MKEVSYIKTQWWRLLIALTCLVVCCIYAFKPAPDTSTVEGLETLVANAFTSCMYLISCLIWLFLSAVEYNNDRIELLEKKAEKYDALCELVEALREANEIDRDIDAEQDLRIKRLEEKIR